VRLCLLAQPRTPKATQQQRQLPLAQHPQERLAAKLEQQAGLQLLLLQTATMQQQEQLPCLFNKPQPEPANLMLLQQLPANKQQQQLAPAAEAAVALIQQQQVLPVLQLMIQQVQVMFLQAVQTAVNAAAQMLVNMWSMPHLQMQQQWLAVIQPQQLQHMLSCYWQREQQVMQLLQQQAACSNAAVLAQQLQAGTPQRQQSLPNLTPCKQQELRCSSLVYSSSSCCTLQQRTAAAAAEAAMQQQQVADMPASASSRCKQSWTSKQCRYRRCYSSPLLLLL
jgi:hypothetical protein